MSKPYLYLLFTSCTYFSQKTPICTYFSRVTFSHKPQAYAIAGRLGHARRLRLGGDLPRASDKPPEKETSPGKRRDYPLFQWPFCFKLSAPAMSISCCGIGWYSLFPEVNFAPRNPMGKFFASFAA